MLAVTILAVAVNGLLRGLGAGHKMLRRGFLTSLFTGAIPVVATENHNENERCIFERLDPATPQEPGTALVAPGTINPETAKAIGWWNQNFSSQIGGRSRLSIIKGFQDDSMTRPTRFKDEMPAHHVIFPKEPLLVTHYFGKWTRVSFGDLKSGEIFRVNAGKPMKCRGERTFSSSGESSIVAWPLAGEVREA